MIRLGVRTALTMLAFAGLAHLAITHHEPGPRIVVMHVHAAP